MEGLGLPLEASGLCGKGQFVATIPTLVKIAPRCCHRKATDRPILKAQATSVVPCGALLGSGGRMTATWTEGCCLLGPNKQYSLVFPCWFQKESITTGNIFLFLPGDSSKCRQTLVETNGGINPPRSCQLGAPFLTPFFGWENSPTEIDYKKGYPSSNLSTGGPSSRKKEKRKQTGG